MEKSWKGGPAITHDGKKTRINVIPTYREYIQKTLILTEI